MTVMADTTFQKRSFLPCRPFKDDLPVSQPTWTAPAGAASTDTTGKVSLLRQHAASAVSETFNKGASYLPSRSSKENLPVSQPAAPTTDTTTDGGSVSLLRRRLSNVSVRIRPLTTSAAKTISSYSLPFRRARSLPTFNTFSPTGNGGPGAIRRWWDWSVGWLLSCKPSFAREMDMDDEESASVGYANKGSWRHVLYRVKAGIRRIVVGGGEEGKGFRYDSFSYAQNFDDGRKSFGY